MASVLFGSIGTIADTSELQRAAFNQAFAQHGLDWHWERDEYVTLLEESGGRKRIDAYAQSQGQSVDAEAIHLTKSDLFQQSLRDGEIQPRPGVVETIQAARLENMTVALVTTTSEQNLSEMFSALSPKLGATDFDLVVNTALVAQPKPAAEAYTFALQKLSEEASRCVAIEDNLDGLAAAQAAGLPCIAFPNQNTDRHAFTGAILRTDRLSFDQVARFLAL
ncbi:MAG: HAD-IA family hydrolase [Elainellaceae cyanobacterium]